MIPAARNVLEAFHWQPQPQAAAWIRGTVDLFQARCPAAKALAHKLQQETGTRLLDWIDSISVPRSDALESELTGCGFEPSIGCRSWGHPGALFPRIELHEESFQRLVIRVESVADFLVAHGLNEAAVVEGAPLGQLRKARICGPDRAELWVVERHGTRSWQPPHFPPGQPPAVLRHQDVFRRRKRRFARPEDGFEHASTLIASAAADLGTDWACDLFFAAEREYWTRRNRAARVQKARQDALGLGWANHDHHTFRSSREHFSRLIAALEALGLVCRERFHAGRDAGWGAQVLEQPTDGIVVFADVDLAAEEVRGDFAHEPLAPRDRLGTVGLWCKLHGEAFLEAGMHHLECCFDFGLAGDQLRKIGIRVMKPFTDLPYLKQAFTEGEIWPVEPGRIETALTEGLITAEQAAQFRRFGAIGSHLEILQRDAGYKGFNQAGINEIIRETDPRSRRQGSVPR